jgi:aromatic-L-amino-acid decarboxylase
VSDPGSTGARALEPDSAELRAQIDAVTRFVIEHLESLPSQPASDVEGALTLAATFREPAPEEGHPLGPLLERLRPAFAKSFTTAGPGYLAFIPGGGIPSAAMADFIACATNRFVGVSGAAPALARIERTTIEWLAAMIGYPAEAGGILTSGGSISNLTAIVCARAAKLPEDFLRGTIYCSEETHQSVDKAARIAGFPAASLRRLPVDARLRLVPAALEAAIESDRRDGKQPFLLIANAGTTNTGAVDPLPEILAIALRQGLWVHADAAYGAFFRLVAEGRTLLPALEECDSVTLDPHKGLFLPYGTGCLLVRDPEALRRSHQGDAAYLPEVAVGESLANFTDLSPELSRDFRGLRIWLPIQLHGLGPFREQLQEKLDLARYAHARLAAEPSLEIIDPPQLSIVAFTCRSARGDANAAAAELLRRVNARRRVFLSSTRIAGRFILRICVLSFRTHRDRVEEAVDAIIEEARRL